MIPRRPMIDTCVIARAARKPPATPDPICVRALDLMAENKARPMISAVIWAELARKPSEGGTGRLVVARTTVEIVNVDVDVADIMARHFPSKTLKSMGSKSERQYWDFDAIIFASAIANVADALVTTNLRDFHALLQAAEYASEIKVKLMDAADVAAPPAPSSTLQGSLFDDGSPAAEHLRRPAPRAASRAEPNPRRSSRRARRRPR